jgi:hypothetical protein
MSMHESIVNPLLSRLSGLEEDRKLLLDRLLTIGGIGPLYNLPVQQDSSPNIENEEELTDPEAEEIQGLLSRFRRRPSRLADAVTRKNLRDYNKLNTGPKVCMVPDMSKINAELDAAEALGKKQA